MKNIKLYIPILVLIFTVVSCSDEEVTSLEDIKDVEGIKDIEDVGDVEDIEIDELTDESIVSKEILKLVNEHRRSLGLSDLEDHNTAKRLAEDHTRYMISIRKINHDDFDKRADVLKEQENALGISENVAKFYVDAESVVNGWLDSDEGHRENIEGNFSYSGVATIKDSDGRYYFTQLFFRK